MTAAIDRSPARTTGRVVAISAAALALALAGGVAQAQRHGGYGGYGGHGDHGYHGHRGGWGPGLFWGDLGLGLGLAVAGAYYYDYDRPNYVVIDQPAPLYVAPPPAPLPIYSAPPAPVAAPQADPIFYPKNGQGAEQAEADRQACNRWATTVPRAMADASVFQRATLACMDGRGYASR